MMLARHAIHASVATLAFLSVELRGASGVVEEPITALSPAGVQLGERTISWDRVRAVAGERAAEAGQFARLADSAWRARIRLARGDTALAQPLFEDLFERHVRHTGAASGPTGLVIAEGLLQCRTIDGQLAAAIEPWLLAARLRERSPGAPGLGALDSATLLAPSLPPIFIATPALAALTDARSLADLVADGANAPASARLAAWTLVAARFEAGQPTGPRPPLDSDHPGVLFISRIVLARTGSPDERAGARDQLRAGLAADAGSWREAWARAAIGRSLLMEKDPALRREGVVELLHLPARFSGTQPTLAALALAEAAAELRRTGDPGAAALSAELLTSDPTGSAARWLSTQAPQSPSPRAAQ